MSDNGHVDPRHPSVWNKEQNEPPSVNPIEELAKAEEKFNELSKKFFTLFLHMETCTKEAAELSHSMSTLLDLINKKLEGAD